MSVRLSSEYPTSGAQRDQWILSHRTDRNALDPSRPYAFLVEEECSATGEVVPMATVFLTNRECPWRCVMCDLWRNTLTETTPAGAIPEQIDYALAQLPAARQIKLYNSGSFFDRRAVPFDDYPAIAARVGSFERTIVESHPALIGDACVRFRDLLSGRLEVAMGLETAHPQVLERLNKQMTLDQFSSAAEFLRSHALDLRVFLLVQPPFMGPGESLLWAKRSLDFAFDCGATAATLILTRAKNGAMEELAKLGEFTPPRLSVLEAAMEYGVGLQKGRVFADLWEIPDESRGCPACFAARVERLQAMNLRQHILPPVVCVHCEGRN